MSKAKKIISTLLAVAMVLTMAPVSGLAALADDGYEYVTPTLTPAAFSVDTTETTEVTRIAAGAGSFSLPDGSAEAPNTIVSATPSGVPSTGGTFSAIAYAGETPSYPKLVFKITGAVLEENPTITPSAGEAISLGPVKKEPNGDTTTYTYEVTGSGTSLAVGTDIVYEIEYVVNGVTYTAYAYSHVENIIIMNGFASYRHASDYYYKFPVGDYADTRHSIVGQYQSHNMYTRMNGADLNVSTGYETDTNVREVSNRVTGYINYAAGSTLDGGAIKGLGSGTDLSSELDAYGSAVPNNAIAGTEQAALIKHVNKEEETTRNMCTNNDTNRGEPVIYLDATDTLESINFRFTMQGAEVTEYAGATLDSFRFVQPNDGSDAYDLTDDCAISDEIYEHTGTAVSSSEISVLGLNYGSNGTASIPAGDYYIYAMAKFGGPGPAASTDLSNNYTVFASWRTNQCETQAGRALQTTAGMNIIFRRYDTRDLRAVYEGILAGDGSTYTCVTTAYAGTPVVFDRGVNPRPAMYNIDSVDKDGNAYATGETDWTMFVKALNTAGSLLARPDLNQTQIDAAAFDLYVAYHNLEGYSDTYYVEIQHCYKGTETPITVNGTQLIQLVNNGNAVKSGQTISTSAATIKGYKVTSSSISTNGYQVENETARKDDISGKIDPATGTNKMIIRYYYEPVTYYVNVAPNNPGYNNYMLSYGYEQNVDLTATNDDGSLVFNYGTRDHYTFVGWLNSNDSKVYDVLGANGTKSFTMPGKDVTLTGQWKITPLKVIGIPVTNKGVVFEGKQLGDDIQLADETTAATFSEPTKYVSSVAADGTKTYVSGKYLNEGYLFGGYYESYDADTNTFSNPVSWPLTFNFGDSDKTIYIRWVDVNGTVSFETNGGSQIKDITYDTTPAEITAPANPTKLGYDFVGWYSDESLTTQILADDGTAWTAGKVKTQQTQTGFLAYAKWTAQLHNITFNMGDPTSAFDTTTNQMPILTGYSDSAVDPDDIPAVPIRYGKIFAQWVIEGTNTVYNFDYYPKEDIVLVPIWNDTQYSAFISIGAYEKLATGETTLVEPTSTATGSAQAGDVVTFRMTSLTNFYVGSSVFVFMYDKNFYDLVADGTSAFKLNSENEYVAGIEASAVGVTNDDTLSRVWPDSLSAVRADYNALMVTIDPTVSSTNYNCEPMSDGTWLIEFQLRVKSTATEGDSGTVYMSNDWTRTSDNIMGTMFYGWAETGDTSVADTHNNMVTPNLDTATATITIDPTPAVDTTVTLNPYGGMWADGGTAAVTYTGREATEIFGFTAPTREGYTIATDDSGNSIWYKLNDDGTVDKSVTWVEGYYATADTNGLTFVPDWEGIPYTVNYYVDDQGGELWDSEEVVYGEKMVGPFYEVEKEGYDFVEWQDAEGNVYTIGESTVPLGGTDLYAQWTPGDVNITVVVNYFDKSSSTNKTQTRTLTAKTESKVKLVASEADKTESGVTYILYSELPTIRGYEFDPSNANNQYEIASVAADGSSVINVYYKAATITYTFDATDGGTFASNGERYITSVGEFGDAFDLSAIEKPTKEGYDFKQWNPAVRTSYTQDTTFTATWTVKKVTITYNANGGNFGTDTTSTASVNYGATIAAPSTAPTRTGYNLLGWAATADGSVLTDFGTATDYTNGHTLYAVWEKASYGVTYTVDGAVSGDVDTVVYEDTVTVRDFPADITGYTFVGWTYDGTTYAPGTTFSMPAGAVVLAGEFVANKYDAVFDATGGYFDGDTAATTKTVADVEFDTTATSPAKPERSGYQFLGWTLTSGSSTIDLTENADFTMDTEGKTYYAVWKATIADYTIEYYEMGTDGTYPATATSSSTMSGQVEGTVTAPTPDKTGFTVDTAASTLSGEVTPAPNNLTLKVYYKRNQHTITWTDNAGTTTQDVYYGAAITAPTAAAKEGHSFSAWTPDVADTMPDSDLAYTAVYTANTYPVIFYKEADKAETVYNNNIAYGTALSSVTFTAPTKAGYALLGWAYEGTTEVLDLTTVTVPVGGVTLVGIWEIQSYTVNFRGNNGTYDDGTNNKAITVVYGNAVAAPEIPDRTGYTFTGWMDNSTKVTYGVNDTLPVMTNAVVNYLAQWSQETYTVNFVIDGTTISENYKYGADIVVPDETQTVKEGWTFQYWTDASGNEVEVPATMEDIGADGASVTYTAYFTIDSHKATFISEGTTVEEKSYNYGAAVNKPTDPSKTGWSFKGWKAADGTLYDAATALPAMGTADVTYTAYFEINSYNAIFVSEGVTVATVPYNYGAAVAKPADPAKTGWTFKGWKDAAGTLYDANTAFPVMGTADVTYTAYFEINSYTATFVAEGVTVETKSYEYGAAVNKPSTDPSKTGYTFKGWKAADGTLYDAATSLPAMGAADVEYTAYFEINTYTVTWVFDNGAADQVDSYQYGKAVTKPSNPSKTGYTFSGWKDGTGAIYAVGADVPAMGAENVTYTAQWNIDSYTATFIVDNVTVETKSYEYGTAVAKPADPTKTGYTFVAWVGEDGTEYDKDTALPAMGTANVEYTAKFEINQYTIVFNAVDGIFTDGKSTYTIKQDYNTMATKPADPTQTGYTFKGWTTVENGQVADIVTVPATWYIEADDVTYYAVWVINSYTVTYYADNEGTVAYTTTLEYGATIQEPEAYDASFVDPALEHYTFEGWSLTKVELEQYKEDVAANVIDFATAAPTVPANDIVIYPVFARVVVTLAIPNGSTAKIYEYDEESEDIIGYITGLETLLEEEKLHSTYLAVKGDGRLVVTLTKYGVCGTGTKVEVIDNLTDEVVETYYLIIFGDVNGDAGVDATDASMASAESANITSWANERSDSYDYCKVLAADISDHDGLVTAVDATAISDIALMVADVEQVNGKVDYYYTA